MEKDTKRKSQCFKDFSVDYVKQFSANDIAHAIQEALKDKNYNKIENYPKSTAQFHEESQWLIHGVFHKIGFYDYQK